MLSMTPYWFFSFNKKTLAYLFSLVVPSFLRIMTPTTLSLLNQAPPPITILRCMESREHRRPFRYKFRSNPTHRWSSFTSSAVIFASEHELLLAQVSCEIYLNNSFHLAANDTHKRDRHSGDVDHHPFCLGLQDLCLQLHQPFWGNEGIQTGD